MRSVVACSAEGRGVFLQFFDVRRIVQLCDSGVLLVRNLQNLRT
jgi:hypothetical protein